MIAWTRRNPGIHASVKDIAGRRPSAPSKRSGQNPAFSADVASHLRLGCSVGGIPEDRPGGMRGDRSMATRHRPKDFRCVETRKAPALSTTFADRPFGSRAILE